MSILRIGIMPQEKIRAMTIAIAKGEGDTIEKKKDSKSEKESSETEEKSDKE